MKTVLFEGPAHTYLPEIHAYVRYLQQNMPDVKPYISSEIKNYSPFEFDVIWRFMGLDVRASGRYVVHEYNSLSTPPAARLKNWTKYALNGHPQRRVFLNKIVRTGFPFRDNCPYILRDMGIASKFFEVKPNPQYDFVYAGSIHRGPEVLKFLEYFAAHMKDSSLLIVGSTNPDVMAHYKSASHIRFAGRVHYNEVAQWVAMGRYGLNLMPDVYPYNVQTATKVLEYCALGLPVVSMKYRWMEHFAQQKDARFFWLDRDFTNLSVQALENFQFQTPDVTARRWRNVIAQSGVFDFLQAL